MLDQLVGEDIRLRWRWQAAASDRSQQRAALTAYLDWMNAQPGETRARLRPYVFRKIVTVTGPETPASELPALALVARAEWLATDAARRNESIRTYELALAQAELASDGRAVALHGLARALYQTGRNLEAVDHWLTLARDLPSTPEAAPACTNAARVSEALVREGEERASARLRTALDLILERYPSVPDIDRWRLLHADHLRRDGAFAEADAGFDRIPAHSAYWPDAAIGRVRTATDQARDDAHAHRMDERDRACVPRIERPPRTLGRDAG